MMNLQPRTGAQPVLGEKGLEHGAVPHERDRAQFGVLAHGQLGASDDLGGAEVPAHGVHGDPARRGG